MAKSYYLPKDDSGRADLFEHFRDHIGDYAATLGIGTPDINSQGMDAVYFRWLICQCNTAQAYAQGITAWKNALRDGDEPASAQIPMPPSENGASPVAPGIVPRFTALVKSIKANRQYTSAIGQALQIEGANAAAPDTDVAQPDLTDPVVVADQVRIPWTKGAYDGVWIEADRGDGKGFAYLATDTRPDYIDTTPFPAGGATWKYRAIYLLNDQKIGQWSATVSVRVGS